MMRITFVIYHIESNAWVISANRVSGTGNKAKYTRDINNAMRFNDDRDAALNHIKDELPSGDYVVQEIITNYK